MKAALLALSSLPETIGRKIVPASELAGRSAPLLPTALPGLDDLLGGGLPRGALVELTAPGSCGRFAAGLAALAAATQAGEAAALVDLGDHLDPQLAAAEGVDLTRLLWIRPRTLPQALVSAETAAAAGFPLVVLDLGLVPLRPRQSLAAAWLRLERAASSHRTALLVLSPSRASGPAARAVLSARARPAWSRTPRAFSIPLLEGVGTVLYADKLRGRRPGQMASLSWRTAEAIVGGPAVSSCQAPATRDVLRAGTSRRARHESLA